MQGGILGEGADRDAELLLAVDSLISDEAEDADPLLLPVVLQIARHDRVDRALVLVREEHVAQADAAVEPVFTAVKHVAKLLSKSLKPDGITIGINQGRASGQEVDHLHIDLMPRWRGDGGSAVQSLVKNPPKESREEIYKKIVG